MENAHLIDILEEPTILYFWSNEGLQIRSDRFLNLIIQAEIRFVLPSINLT